MMKKIALLVSLVMIFSLSFVFATSENQDTLLAVSGEITELSGDEVVSGEVAEAGDAVVSGEVAEEDEVSGDILEGNELPLDDEVSEEADVSEDVTTSGNETVVDVEEGSNTVLGAVIAIVIVVAVVAIVAVLKKK